MLCMFIRNFPVHALARALRVFCATALGLLTSALPQWAVAQSILNEPLSLDTGSGVLAGSLMLPKRPEAVPLAILVAGSGPTDRNGNNPFAEKLNTLQFLAKQLASLGVASVRYDKRGIGASVAAAPDERTLRVAQYASDVGYWINRFKNDPRFSHIVLIGHSEGALMASLAATEHQVDALILLSGSGRNIATVLAEQLYQALPEPLFAQSLRIIETLQQGLHVDQVPDALAPIFRSTVQPYLSSLFAYEPAEVFAQTQMPTLIVWGDQDHQVSRADAQALASARPDAAVVMIQGMDHMLRISTSAGKKYPPNSPLAWQLGVSMEKFLRNQGILPPLSDTSSRR